MARVDLQCGCGYMFFVGDNQLNQPGGVKCPACMHPVEVPAGAVAKAKAAPAAGKPAAAAPAAPPEPASKTTIYIVAGVVGVVVLAAIVGLIVFLSSPGVDYEKQAEMEERARKRQIEEIAAAKGGKLPSAPGTPLPAPGTPAQTSKPATAPQAPRSTEYKPMPAAPATTKPNTPQTPAPAQPNKTAAQPMQGVPLNDAMVAQLRSEVLPLHPFYLGLLLTPAEKARADGIALSGRGSPEDADFLQAVLKGAKLKSILDEIAGLTQTLPTLERESSENLPVDKVTLVDGNRVMNCKILEEGAEVVRVMRTLASGVGGQMTLRRDAINKLEKGRGVGTEFATRWPAVQKGAIAQQVELLGWCKENNLAGQAKLVAYTILRADPSNTVARAEAGLPADPVRNSEEIARGGVIAYQGRNWPAKELKDKFLKDGFCVLDGKWYSKKDKMIVVPGLFRYERQADKPVNFGGTAPLCHDTETIYKQAQDVATGQFIEQAEVRFLRRFYAPEMKVALVSGLPPGVVAPVSTFELDIRVNVDEGVPGPGVAMKGEVTINVPVGAVILEASVITVAEVKSGGSITVYHAAGPNENDKRTKLYTCDPKESQSHNIPVELVRGTTEVNLVAVIEEQAAYIAKTERRHVRAATRQGKILVSPAVDIIHYKQIPDYKAVLFPSNSNTIEVFRLKLALADPSPMLDKLFVTAPDVLK